MPYILFLNCRNVIVAKLGISHGAGHSKCIPRSIKRHSVDCLGIAYCTIRLMILSSSAVETRLIALSRDYSLLIACISSDDTILVTFYVHDKSAQFAK